jgi:hypothetical protein
VHVIPVLLGGGTPLFDRLDSAITLERTQVLVTLPRRTWDFGWSGRPGPDATAPEVGWSSELIVEIPPP